MARRSNMKIKKAHHDAMLVEETGKIAKKRSSATRRAKRAEKKRVEAALCDIFDHGLSVGEDKGSPVPHIGAPVAPLLNKKAVKKVKRAKKNKKAARRKKKILERQANRSAMTM